MWIPPVGYYISQREDGEERSEEERETGVDWEDYRNDSDPLCERVVQKDSTDD